MMDMDDEERSERDYDWAYNERLNELAEEEEVERIKSLFKQKNQEELNENIGFYLDKSLKEKLPVINSLRGEAKKLFDEGYSDASLTIAVTVSEVIIRSLLIKPLIYGAYRFDNIVEAISNFIIERDRLHKDREMLPWLMKIFQINLDEIKMSNASSFWTTYKQLLGKRNGFVHRGQRASLNDAKLMLECLDIFFQKVLSPIFQKFQIDTDARFQNSLQE